MGNCASSGLEHECEKCGATPQTNRNLSHKGKWVHCDNGTYCRPCHISLTLEKEKYEKERAFYARAKVNLYPKLTTNPRLKRIDSNESWASGASFQQSWRPGSAIQHLVESFLHHKKVSSDISSPRAVDDFPHDETGPSSSSSGDDDHTGCPCDLRDPKQLQESLDNSIQELDVGYVSEEDLVMHDSETGFLMDMDMDIDEQQPVPGTA